MLKYYYKIDHTHVYVWVRGCQQTVSIRMYGVTIERTRYKWQPGQLATDKLCITSYIVLQI